MNSPVVLFRTKATPIVGFGHLHRCMTLANELKKRSVEICFVVNQQNDVLALLQENNFVGIEVSDDDESHLKHTLAYIKKINASALVIDTYDIKPRCLAKENITTVVIEDRAELMLPVDIVINGSVSEAQVDTSKQPHTQFLLGPEYILLNAIFSKEPQRTVRESIEHILITVGGGDPSELTLQLISWVKNNLSTTMIDVVIGPFFHEEVKRKINALARLDDTIKVHQHLATLYDLMMNCDLAVTSGGQTTFELAATGTPAIAIDVADNQLVNLKLLSDKRTLIWAGSLKDADLGEKIIKNILVLSYHERKKMSQQGRLVIDGLGAQRVANAILKAVSGDECGRKN